MTTVAFALDAPAPTVLALGAWFKNTVCAVRGNEARLSAVIGDLDSAEACLAHEAAAGAMLGWLGYPPLLIAHDLHPDFHSSRHAADLAARLGVPQLPVQHHHAHIGAVCAEHNFRQPVIGLALDGVGLGADGQAWGGELLRVDGAHCERLGHLLPLALPGGDRAAREPWRMAASVFHALGRGQEIVPRFAAVATENGAATVATMLERNINSPRSSSMGRVFDAAAGLLGLCSHMSVEAEAAIALEQAATRYVSAKGWPPSAEDGWRIDQTGHVDGSGSGNSNSGGSSISTLSLLPLLAELPGADDKEAAAARFHATLVAALGDWVSRAADQTGIRTIAWSGGCFLNRLLSSGLKQNLDAHGLSLLVPQQLSPGDACISAGQAWVAIRSLE